MGRKTLKLNDETYEKLKAVKRDGETYTTQVEHLIEESGRAVMLAPDPVCADCGRVVERWSQDDAGRVICTECAPERAPVP